MSDTQKRGTLPRNADEHIARLRHQLTHNAECGTTHYNLGVALLGKQEYMEAEKAFHDAIDHSPTLAEAYVQLGGICLQRGDLEGCFRFNQRATKRGPVCRRVCQHGLCPASAGGRKRSQRG